MFVLSVVFLTLLRNRNDHGHLLSCALVIPPPATVSREQQLAFSLGSPSPPLDSLGGTVSRGAPPSGAGGGRMTR